MNDCLVVVVILALRLTLGRGGSSLSNSSISPRVLPAFTWHRKDWSILHPYVHLTDIELDDLKKFPGKEAQGRLLGMAAATP